MEAKKNTAHDLNLQRNKFFLIGLSISIALVITAFEWRTEKKEIEPRVDHIDESYPLVIIPNTIIDPPPAPLPIQKIEQAKNSILPTEIVSINSTLPQDIPYIDMDDPTTSLFVSVNDMPEEKDTTYYIFVEQKPEPISGFDNFYKHISTYLKYPAPARRMGTEGRVFVEFIINRNGDLSDLKVIRGIGAGCDEEAVRVLALTKWEPGKQRGKPVRVKMILPIHFRLSN